MLRVVTFNILHGRTPGGGVDPALLAASVRQLDPDVLALQEVDVDQGRSGRVDLTAVVAKAMDAVDHRFVATLSGTPGGTWSAATGSEQPGSAAYGIALLSRFPASEWQVLRLPRNRLRVDAEPRTAVLCRVATPLGPFTVANTHLSFVPGRNRRQLRYLVEAVQALPGPRLVLGDLNLSPTAVRRRSGLRALAVAPTFPADRPRRQLDHVLTDDAELLVRRWDAPWMPVSDHRPLIAELERNRW